MANTTVTKVSDLLLTNVTAGTKAGDQKVSDAQGFTEVMNNAKDGVAKTTETNKPDDPARSSRTVVETPKSKEIRAEEPVRRDPVGNKDDMDDLTAEVAAEASAIMDRIKEVLDVSDEELTQAMEDLGITAVDLLDPSIVKDLLMDLNRVEDSISLLTDAKLYENVKEIVIAAEDAGNKVAADFGLSKDELSEIFKDSSFVQKIEEAVAETVNNAQAPEVFEGSLPGVTETVNTGIPNETEMPKQDMDVTRQTDTQTSTDLKDTNAAAGMDADKAVTVEVTGTPGDAARTAAATEAKVIKPEAKTDVTATATEAVKQSAQAAKSDSVTETFKAAEESDKPEFKGTDEGLTNASRFAEVEMANVPGETRVVNTEVNNLGEVVETVTTYSSTEADSIMSQVTESIRVNYSADTTSMEMQLHPASLGTVNMQIASTGGVVTAHILVQSEAVKAALESQLITLQQTFEEQGQRVEAVEVSVANYDLNRGSSSDAGSESEDRGFGRTGRTGGRRRINLADLEEEDIEELSEEEKLSADMMARSGNSVDYTA
ncbi:MAG: flagellar hook-length control protein FliK [Lachnospiraceae bacterium]|nr:flagellar hook-length control protein FliK [Lachnospiraceae bacterium]